MNIKNLSPELDAKLDAIFAHHQVSGAGVAVIHKGKTFIKPYGVRALGGADPVTERTAFNIGSVSKAFTATAAGILVDEKKLHWDDPIRKYVPEFEMYDPWISDHVTLRDLSGNRTGIPRSSGVFTDFGFAPDADPNEVFRRFKHAQPQYPFRDRFTYRNAGHMAVAQAVARVSGMPFSQFVEERLFRPLGMNRSAVGARAEQLPELMGWHTVLPEGMTPIPTVYGESYVGAGAVVMSLTDATVWMRVQLEGGEVNGVRIISRAGLAEIHRPQVSIGAAELDVWNGLPDTRFSAYCLGWALAEYEGHTVIRHGGNDLGASAQIFFVPDHQLAIAVFIGAAMRAAPLEAGYVLLQYLLGTRERDWRNVARASKTIPPDAMRLPVPSGQPTRPLPAYCGTYSHIGEGDITVSQTADGLRADFSFGVLYNGRLEAAGGDRFTIHCDNIGARGLVPQALATLAFSGNEPAPTTLCLMETLLAANAPRFVRTGEKP